MKKPSPMALRTNGVRQQLEHLYRRKFVVSELIRLLEEYAASTSKKRRRISVNRMSAGERSSRLVA